MAKSTNAKNKPQRQFYRDMQKWIREGCPEHKIFNRRMGLCSNYIGWCWDNNRTFHSLARQFQAMGYASHVYPFNTSLEEFINEKDKYANPLRLKWIKFFANH